MKRFPLNKDWFCTVSTNI